MGLAGESAGLRAGARDRRPVIRLGIDKVGGFSALTVDWIRVGLKRTGKTRSGLAKALGRSPSAVTDLLNGQRRLRADEIAIVADYLGVEPPRLVGGGGRRDPPQRAAGRLCRRRRGRAFLRRRPGAVRRRRRADRDRSRRRSRCRSAAIRSARCSTIGSSSTTTCAIRRTTTSSAACASAASPTGGC